MKRIYFTLDLKPLPFRERCRLRFHRVMYILQLHWYGIYKKLEVLIVNDEDFY